MGMAGARKPPSGAAFQEEGALTYHGASQHPLRCVAMHFVLWLDTCLRLLWSRYFQTGAPGEAAGAGPARQ